MNTECYITPVPFFIKEIWSAYLLVLIKLYNIKHFIDNPIINITLFTSVIYTAVWVSGELQMGFILKWQTQHK
jgi:hypothetical protein